MKNKKLRVINVLDKEFYDDCHIKGSINVPLKSLREYVEQVDRSTPLVVYCASYSCNASRDAWQMLYEMGFSSVRAYEGGIREWYLADMPTGGSCLKGYAQGPKEEPPQGESVVKKVDMHTLYEEMKQADLL